MRTSRAPRGIEHIGRPAENLAAFVALAVASTNLGTDLDFYAWRWDVTGKTRDRPGLLSGRRSVGFEPWVPRGEKAARKAQVTEGCTKPDALPGIELFNRSFVRLMDDPSHSQMKLECVTGSLLAEAMEQLCVRDVADITRIVLTKAARIATARYTKDYRLNVAYALEQRALFLDANGLTSKPVKKWRFPGRRLRRGAEGRSSSRSDKLLPSKDQLALIHKIYHAARAACDLIVTRILVLLLAAPERINEALAIGVDPEIEVLTKSGGRALQLRWLGSKQYPDGVKPIPNVIADDVRKSLTVLREQTAEGRRILKWYRENPGKLYLPPDLEYLRQSERLCGRDVARLLGMRNVSSADRRIKQLGIQQGLPPRLDANASWSVSFQAIERYFLSMLPAKLKDIGAPDSEPLLVVRWKTFRCKSEEPCPCMFEKVTYRRISAALTEGETNVTIARRLVDRNNKQSITTKSIRHLLTTLALRGNMRETDLALWSGRHDTRHNRAYDQRTPAEMRTVAKRANPHSNRITSPLARTKARKK